MRTVLSVAEKPSVAKELAAIISRQHADSTKRPGISPFNPVFEIPNATFMNSPARMIVTSVTGHLMEIEFDGTYKGWNSCQPVELFTAPIRKTVKKEGENIQKTLIREARQSNILMLWLDCDLEGENIAYEVIKVCLEANPRLDVYRARFSALVERDIFRTLKVPDRPNKYMNDAVDARQEIDLRIGAAFTRFQTLRLQRKYENIGNSVISFGPCQFPTLGFVVERSTQIKAFRPESFWRITCSYNFDNPDKIQTKILCNFNWERVRVYDQFTCIVLYEMCLESNGKAIVTQCNERPTSKYRPIPLNTIDLQMKASKQLRMSSDHAMAIAESLYQRGILSYPRTETNFFQQGIDVLSLVRDHRNHPDWGNYVAQLVDNHDQQQQQSSINSFQWPRAGGKDDQAHPPIHPTKCMNLQDLQNDDERRIYDLVSRHFLACCSKDAIGSLSHISISVPDIHGEKFNASGLMVLHRNYLDVYSAYDYWSASKIPVLKVGDEIMLHSLLMEEGRTCPPQLLSEAELISTMDKNGIGTDATIATHISTIQAREYAIRNAQNQFEPTKLGLALVEGYNSMGYQLNKPQLRALIEADCQRIAKGEVEKEEVVRKCLEDMKHCFQVCSREANKLDIAMEKHFTALGLGGSEYHIVTASLSRCGDCRSMMDLRSTGAGDDNRSISRYLYCAECMKSYIMPRGDLTGNPNNCAICSFQALGVRNPESGKEHTICPKCFSNPPAAPVGIEGATEFRCFSCAHEECALAQRTAGSEVNIAACSAPRCTGFMRLKKNQKGYLLACSVSTCRVVWWIPKCVRSVTIPAAAEQNCQRCLHQRHSRVCKMRFRFVLERAPPGCPPESLVCPCCDPLWEEIGHTALSVVSNTNAPAAAVRGAGASVASNILNNHTAVGNSGSDYQAALAGKRRGRIAATTTSTARGNSSAEAVTASPKCSCGIVSKVLTVAKEGPNQGRQFHACSKPRGQGCSFFEWADQGRGGAAGPHTFVTTTTTGGANTGTEPPPPLRQCACGNPTSVLVTKKEGPNMGRRFHACRKPRDDPGRCDFFEWV